MLTFFSLVPRWAWFVAGGVGVSIALLILWQSAMGRAERRGYERAQQEAYEAAQAQAEAWAKQVRDADRKAALSIDRLNKAERSSRERIKQHYAQSPSSCGISPPGVGLLYQADSERAACAATGRCYALRKAPAASEGAGSE